MEPILEAPGPHPSTGDCQPSPSVSPSPASRSAPNPVSVTHRPSLAAALVAAGAGLAERDFEVWLEDGRRVAVLFLETSPAEIGWPDFIPSKPVPESEGR